MGDRCRVIFRDSTGVSPTVHVHWVGSLVPQYLKQMAGAMKDEWFPNRFYAAARFIGIVCRYQSHGIGVLGNSFTLADLDDSAKMKAESHGDAGVVVVDCKDFSWKAYGGYLKEHKDCKR